MISDKLSVLSDYTYNDQFGKFPMNFSFLTANLGNFKRFYWEFLLLK